MAEDTHDPNIHKTLKKEMEIVYNDPKLIPVRRLPHFWNRPLSSLGALSLGLLCLLTIALCWKYKKNHPSPAGNNGNNINIYPTNPQGTNRQESTSFIRGSREQSVGTDNEPYLQP